VDELLQLKGQYKSLTGTEWNPNQPPPKQQSVSGVSASVGDSGSHNNVGPDANGQGNPLAVSAAIRKQGDRVRQLKSEKADKTTIKAEVDKLLSLKADYKSLIGQDWTPDCASSDSVPAAPSGSLGDTSLSANVNVNQAHQLCELWRLVKLQGDKVRALKESKSDKAIIKSEVASLLSLKAEYKSASGGIDWDPARAPPTPTKAAPSKSSQVAPGPAPASTDMTKAQASTAAQEDSLEAVRLKAAVEDQGNAVRTLKQSGSASKSAIDDAVAQLLALKGQYKELTGVELAGGAKGGKQPKKGSQSASSKSAQQPKKPAAGAGVAKGLESNSDSASKPELKKQTRLGLEAKKEENFADWYSQVITKAELIDYYDISGCYIIRPWAFAIWEAVQGWFDAEIKALGVSNCYFPVFVSQAALEKEKTHIADFAPEVAWVTKSGDTDLDVPIAIRPTSETVMYPTFARWVQSYRDLPIRVNQWCSVVRWEFKHPTPFIRTREFLWQEGHTAWATREAAVEEVYQILDRYSRVYTDLLAIPVVKGRKTEKEKFAGGDFTTTIEAYIGVNGRAVQAATSHHLGQNFAKMFDIVFENPETQAKEYVHQNSWGLTTRSIGVLVMVHGDNTGLVLPPRIAKIQVIVVPCGITAGTSKEAEQTLHDACLDVKKELAAAGVRVDVDLRDNISPGWKFNHWELKGIPIRLELGPRDLQKGQFVTVRRDTGGKDVAQRADLTAHVNSLLSNIQQDMYNRVKKEMDAHIVVTDDWSEFCSKLEKKCLIQAPFCGVEECEDKIKKDSASEEVEPGAPSMGAKSLCIPTEQPRSAEGRTCVHPDCSHPAQFYCMFGRSY
jgi:bifunctional glutamyl/prolyl-tRNA synthetase